MPHFLCCVSAQHKITMAESGSFRAFAASFSNDSFGPKVIMVKGMAFRLPQRHINL